jgi:hypothetical protein
MSLNDAAEGVAPIELLEAAAAVIVALSAANFFVASFALFASIAVPAARPITAADNTAMTQESTKTRSLHPQTMLFDFFVNGS